jgi:hypothetical protein
VNNPDCFCYICGKYTMSDQRKNMTKRLRIAYKHYFGCEIGDQTKSWAPHLCCTVCYSGLTQWLNGKRNRMPFAVPMIWREQNDHHSDCYFCMTNVSGYCKKNKSKIVYPDCRSALKPVLHGSDYPVPIPPSSDAIDNEESDTVDNNDSDTGAMEYTCDPDSDIKKPHLISQAELDDLVRDLTLSKEKSELLGSRLKEWNLLQRGATVAHFRHRHMKFAAYYSVEHGFCFCHDVTGLMRELDKKYVAEEWRLFIDSSSSSLKAALLNNGNKKPSIPIAHAVEMKETYETMNTLLMLIKYSEHSWNICSDLKVVALLLGMQTGYTKHMCFLCLWNSRDDKNHYIVKNWPPRNTPVIGQHNVQHAPLVDRNKIYLPPLHIKLGLMKQFVAAMDQTNSGFRYIKDKFGKRKTDAKLKAGVFVGPEIRELIRDPLFRMELTEREQAAWDAFVLVVHNFLGNHRADNYAELVENLLTAYQHLGCRMSLKMHFLHSHLTFFPSNMGAVSDEHGEKFHQEMSTMEARYQGRFNPNMMGDYCWFLQRATEDVHRRKPRSSTHF